MLHVIALKLSYKSSVNFQQAFLEQTCVTPANKKSS